jgi:two-component system response regulator MtrA
VTQESLLFVEDDASVRRTTGLLLRRAGYRVVAVAEGMEALDAVDAAPAPFDLVLLDVMLPTVDGFEVCRRLRERSNVPVIMLTARGDVADVVAGLEVGADDYVTKPFEPAELIARVRAALRRTALPNHERTIVVGPLSIDVDARKATLGSSPLELTSTEFRLLAELAAHNHHAFSREELLERVWGYDYLGDSRLVDMAITRLRAKLSAAPGGLSCISTVRGVGYRFDH